MAWFLTGWYGLASILLATTAAVAIPMILRWRAWGYEREQLRGTILEQLGVSGMPRSEALVLAGNRVEALIPVRVPSGSGRWPGSGRTWLCFTQDRLLILG